MLVRRFSFAIRSWTFSNSGAKIQEKLIIFAIFQSEILSIFIYDKGGNEWDADPSIIDFWILKLH